MCTRRNVCNFDVVITCLITTVAGPHKETVAKDRPLPSQSHAGSLQLSPEPVGSWSFSGLAHRSASEPIRKPSQQQQQLIFSAKLKVASDASLDSSRVKKPKSGIETNESLCR